MLLLLDHEERIIFKVSIESIRYLQTIGGAVFYPAGADKTEWHQ
jgi:hypothetical protein